MSPITSSAVSTWLSGTRREDDGVLARGGGVQLAAHLVEDLGDLERAVAARALEEQVLDEVRDAGLRRRSRRASPAPIQKPIVDRAHVRQPLRDDPLARVELGLDPRLHGRIVRGGPPGGGGCRSAGRSGRAAGLRRRRRGGARGRERVGSGAEVDAHPPELVRPDLAPCVTQADDPERVAAGGASGSGEAPGARLRLRRRR